MATHVGLINAALDKARQVKYWKRCIKTFLPSQYTSNDANRMYLAYFIVSALELLDALDSTITVDERNGYIDWIYHCQHPRGGFRMWPGTDFNERASSQNARWDPAHLPATYFALTTLVTLGDDLRQVSHVNTLAWLRTMQRPDGSFGETFVDGKLQGGRDPRYGYCAAAIRKILRQVCSEEEMEASEDIDTSSLADCVLAGQSYDGGIADEIFHEPQAGYTFCALGTLDLIGVLDASTRLDHEAVVKWLLDRQTDLIDEGGDDGLVDLGRVNVNNVISGGLDLQHATEQVSSDTLQQVHVRVAGMNGRPNKVADTCYAWWVGASLHMLGQELYSKPAVRAYLLLLTQNLFMGGFTKFPGDKHSDIYHSFMGLAALSLASTVEERQQDGIKAWDASMCVSMDVRKKLNALASKTG